MIKIRRKKRSVEKCSVCGKRLYRSVIALGKTMHSECRLRSLTEANSLAYPNCAVCLEPMERLRKKYKYDPPVHHRCVHLRLFTEKGECRTCGEVVPDLGSRGGHNAHCSGNGVNPPNWRLYKNADEIAARHSASLSKALKGKPQPWHSQRMKDNNPTKRQDVREAIKMSWVDGRQGAKVPYGRGAGGKGTEGTSGEKFAWEILRELGFEQEKCFGVKASEREACGGAMNYTADFFHEGKALVIELDGSSHKTPGRSASNARKDAFLADKGITVVRLTGTPTRSQLLRAAGVTKRVLRLKTRERLVTSTT